MSETCVWKDEKEGGEEAGMDELRIGEIFLLRLEWLPEGYLLPFQDMKRIIK